jgi:hypothetical protein
MSANNSEVDLVKLAENLAIKSNEKVGYIILMNKFPARKVYVFANAVFSWDNLIEKFFVLALYSKHREEALEHATMQNVNLIPKIPDLMLIH